MTLNARIPLAGAALAVGYAALSYAGLQWATFGAAVSPIWPAAGLAVAGLLLGGIRLWPSVFVGTLIGMSLATDPLSLASRVVVAGANCVALVAALRIMQRLKVDPGLRRPRDLLLVCGVGGLGSGLIAGVISVVGFTQLEDMAPADAPTALVRWVVGDFVGVVLITPAVLAWARPDPLPRSLRWWIAFAGLLVATAIVSWKTFVAPDVGPIVPWHVLTLLVTAALLTQLRVSVVLNLVAASAALYGSLTEATATTLLTEGRSYGVQQYVIVMSLTALLVAVMVERLRYARVAIEKEERSQAAIENEARVLLAQAAGRVGSWDWREGMREAVCSDTVFEIFGWETDRSTVSFAEWAERVHPDDRERAVAEALDSFKSAKPYWAEYRILLPSGEVRHIESRASSFASGGRTRRVVGVVVDITERRQADERQRLLMREVDHRAKNALAVVLAILRLTKAEKPQDFAAKVEGRVQAIARAHNLLARAHWVGVNLRRLIEDETEAYRGAVGGEHRVWIEGPDVTLGPDAAQPLALVLHELATNAAKHGAFSTPSGRVAVTWKVNAASDRLCFRWLERGGPQTSEPVGNGFGSRLVTASVERQLHGSLRQEWTPEGLDCEIEIPLARALADPADVEESGSGDYDRSSAGLPKKNGANGRRLLLVEDEVLVGLDMKANLEELGWRVTGPIGRANDAMRAIDIERPDAAVLDVNLGGETTKEIAARLNGLGVPFAFATGYGDYASGIAEYGAPVLLKPVAREDLSALRSLLESPLPAKAAP